MTGKKILLVEDEYLVGINIRFTLNDAGYDVTGPIMRINSALSIIDDNRFDAVVLDVNLGGQYSIAIAHKLSERGIPYLLLTGYTREDLPPEVYDAPLIEKPFQEDTLLETLRNMITDKNPS